MKGRILMRFENEMDCGRKFQGENLTAYIFHCSKIEPALNMYMSVYVCMREIAIFYLEKYEWKEALIKATQN